MSIRVIIDESDPKNPEVIDYEFFKREDQFMRTNKSYLSAECFTESVDKQENYQEENNET